MRVGDLTRLDVPLKRLSNPFRYIEALSTGKRALNVGAAGGVEGYLPDCRDIWLHERIRKHADSVLGIDIDRAGIDYAGSHGVELEYGDCEHINLGRTFDLIVMSDVIEHVNAPVNAISNLLSHLADHGKLLITTPNATAGNILLRSAIGKAPNVLSDHVTIYYPEHFQSICDRLGCRLKAVYMFDHIDRRSRMLQFKSSLFQLMTSISARLASSMMIIIEKQPGPQKGH